MAVAKTEKRSRCYATILYPESCRPDWREVLSGMHIQALASPLHDRDFDDGGNLKKPHYHVMFYFPGKKSIAQIQAIVDQLGGVGCIPIESKQGYARYLCHLDDTDKTQYAPTDVRGFGGADFSAWAELDKDPMLFIPDMMDFIERHDIVSFYQFALYCSRYRPEWSKILCTRATVFFKEYLKSRAWEGSDKEFASYLVDCWEKKEVIAKQ